MKYWAFLSYSHTDARWGDWLHKTLETYRIPHRLIGTESRDGKIPERLFPIFRDREELPVSSDLGSNINEALRESRYLIVICSPRSAQSRWVGEEIRAFKELGREDRILALIVDGEPNAGDAKLGFKIEDECFHELMRYRLGPDGNLTTQRTEPIAADAREGKDGRNNAKLKLLAGLLGVNYDALKQRDQERRLRRTRGILTAAAALLVVFVALSVALFFKQREATRTREEATRSRDEARARLSDNYLDRGLALLRSGDRTQGTANLVAALRADPTNSFAADRLLFELNYGDWLLANTVVSIPEDLQRFSKIYEETSVLKAELSVDGKNLEATTLDFEGRPARSFRVNLARGDWEPVTDQRKARSASPDRFFIALRCEDYEVRLRETNPELKRLKQILDREFSDWPPSLCFSNDRRWAAFIEYNSDAYPSGASPLHLMDWSQGKEITLKSAGEEVTVTNVTTGEKSTQRELVGLPAFDAKHSLVWLFREGRANSSELEGIDLVSGNDILKHQIFPSVEGLQALRPRVTRDGNELIVRYAINNRLGEAMSIFSVELGSDEPLKPVANDLRLPGILSGVATDGDHFVAILPTSIVVYRLLKHCTPSHGPLPKAANFERADAENGNIEALSADGNLKATGNAEGHFVIADRRSGATIASFESQSYEGVDASGRYVHFAKFSSDSRWLFVWGGNDNYGSDTEIYDPRSGRLIYNRFGPGHRDNDFAAIQAEGTDGSAVLLRNDKIVRLRLTDGSMPQRFAELAEGIIGAYLDDRGVYRVHGTQDARPCASIRELRAILEDMNPSSSWTKFAKDRLSLALNLYDSVNTLATGQSSEMPLPGERHPETRLRVLTSDELKSWPTQELQSAINETYARHGAVFPNQKIQESFSRLPWYHAQADKTFDEIESQFTDIERGNVQSLGEARDSKAH